MLRSLCLFFCIHARTASEFECSPNYNFVIGISYDQIQLTDSCNGGVCDANPKYVPDYASGNSISGAVDYCRKICIDRADCTWFFFQKHTNGHEVCGFYASDLHSVDITWVWHGHAQGSQICELLRSVEPEPAALTTVFETTSTAVTSVHTFSVSGSLKEADTSSTIGISTTATQTRALFGEVAVCGDYVIVDRFDSDFWEQRESMGYQYYQKSFNTMAEMLSWSVGRNVDWGWKEGSSYGQLFYRRQDTGENPPFSSSLKAWDASKVNCDSSDACGTGQRCAFVKGSVLLSSPSWEGTQAKMAFAASLAPSATMTAISAVSTLTTTSPISVITTTEIAIPALITALSTGSEFECSPNYNFVIGISYDQIQLTDSCNGGVCDANPKYVPDYTSGNSISCAVNYCQKICIDRSDCTGFFFQKHTNGHEICGFYASDLHSVDITWVWHGHAQGSQICEFLGTRDSTADTSSSAIGSEIAIPTVTTTSPISVITTTEIAIPALITALSTGSEFECSQNFNFVIGISYDQIQLTDSCNSGVCDAKPKYVPDYTPGNSISGAVDYCQDVCIDRSDCTGFFFQKHTNGHEICGFYSSDLHSVDITRVWHGHAQGSQICELLRSVEPEPAALTPVFETTSTAVTAVHTFSVSGSLKDIARISNEDSLIAQIKSGIEEIAPATSVRVVIDYMSLISKYGGFASINYDHIISAYAAMTGVGIDQVTVNNVRHSSFGSRRLLEDVATVSAKVQNLGDMDVISEARRIIAQNSPSALASHLQAIDSVAYANVALTLPNPPVASISATAVVTGTEAASQINAIQTQLADAVQGALVNAVVITAASRSPEGQLETQLDSTTTKFEQVEVPADYASITPMMTSWLFGFAFVVS